MSEEAPKKVRAFIAIDAPQEWKETLGELTSRFKKRFRAAHMTWTSPEQFHITLRFLGHVTAEELSAAEVGVRAVCAGTNVLRLYYHALGCFPRPSLPRVFWCGARDETGGLLRLQQEITRATAAIGKAPEEREFHPHLTLARIKEMPASLRKSWAEAIEKNDFRIENPWIFNEVHLMKSQLGPSGAKYSVVASFALGRN